MLAFTALGSVCFEQGVLKWGLGLGLIAGTTKGMRLKIMSNSWFALVVLAGVLGL